MLLDQSTINHYKERATLAHAAGLLTDGADDGKEAGADTIERLVWEIEAHALSAATEAVRDQYPRWYNWKPSTHVKIYIEQGICTPLRGEDWFMQLTPKS